jgi:hypothetical protein
MERGAAPARLQAVNVAARLLIETPDGWEVLAPPAPTERRMWQF